MYKRFMRRVIDLVEVDKVEAAGRILITLVTEGANVALGKPESITTNRYRNLLKATERMCSVVILGFTGQTQSDLIMLCQNLTHISLASHFWDMGKQCRPRSDAAACGV